MIPMTLAEIAAAVGGDVVDVGGDADGADIQVTGDVFHDSRQVVADGLFVAIAGERVDGHEFAARAVQAGAAAALVERPVGIPAVVVPDTIRALTALATVVVGRLPTLRVIGITGSQGKTSTKDIVAQLLERTGETIAPVGSYNNEIGAPLTALRVRPTTAYLISEMGARGRHHIRDLAAMVRPTVGLVLNVGVAHIGEFGTQDEIAVAKREIVEALPEGGLAVLNADDARVVSMRDHTAARVLTFGAATDADVRISDLNVDDNGYPVFVLRAGADAADVVVPLVGEHQAVNAAAAAATALGLGMPFPDVVDTLRTLTSRSRWRMEVSQTTDGVTLINDAYNANPDSMRAALKTLVDFGQRRGVQGRTIAVLGEMRELGTTSNEEHDAIGRLVAQLDVSQLVVVGEEARPIHLAANRESVRDDESVAVPDADAAIAFLRGALRPGDVVLVKASRAAGLERVAAALMAEDDQAMDRTREADG
jgi:UDP-N-acetylmuramoyl-tripeptide--D-alanyl-D-alanine ligase